jgi:type I restriction enzyme S subunit
MEKYTYKDSGIEWLGEIPEHWKTKRLFNICDFVRGNSGFEKNDLLSEGKYVALQYGKTYKVEEVNELFNFYVSDNFYKSSQIVNFGDVIFVSTSETMEDLGHSVFYNRNDIGLIGGEQILLKPNKNVLDGKYLFYASKMFGNGLNKFATGIKVFRFDVYDLKTIYISLPQPKEQKAIAEYLDKATAKIDRIIAIKQEQLLKMEDYYDSRIHEYITKGINKSDFIESGIDWQGEVPKHWKKEKLFRLADKMGSGGTPKSTNQDYYGGEISWIQSGDLNDWIVSTTKKTITEEALNNSSAKMFEKGTLLIAMYGATIGKLGIMGMDSATNQACCAIQVGSKLDSDFLFYLLYDMRKFLISQGYGGGQQNISQETLKQQYFYYPEKNEQIEIVNQIKDFRSKQEVIRDNVKSQIETLQAYRKNLIHECVTGKKQVTSATINKAYA